MSLLIAFTVLQLFLVVTHSSEVAPTELCWEPAFTPGGLNLPRTIPAIQCLAVDTCYMVGSGYGTGYGVYQWDGQVNGQVNPMDLPNDKSPGLITSFAVGGTKAAPAGAFGVFGFFTYPLYYVVNDTTSGSEVWKQSNAPFQAVTMIQAVRASKDGNTVLAADTTNLQTAIYQSTDGGVNFSLLNITGLPALLNCSGPQGFSVIDANTWYLLQGQYSDHSQNSSQRVFTRNADGSITFRKSHHHFTMISRGPVDDMIGKHDKCDPGYAGQIAKTTDGGKTWQNLFTQVNTFSFYDIDCFNATMCVAVGHDDFNSYVYTTSDGLSFNKVLEIQPSDSDSVFLTTVRYANASDIWVGGSLRNSIFSLNGDGVFYYSKDGGTTFLRYPHLQPIMTDIADLSFAGDEGFATGPDSDGTSTVLRYTSQPYYGYFTQQVCPYANCTFLCQNTTFPQGMCLPLSGSDYGEYAIATCTTQGLQQDIYTSSDCSGTFNTTYQPLNQCLNQTDGTFFENLCEDNIWSVPRKVGKSSASSRVEKASRRRYLRMMKGGLKKQ